MTARQDFAVRLLLALAAMFVLSPLVAWVLPNEQFHRVMTRVLQGAVLIALLVKRPPRRTWKHYPATVGLRGPDRTKRALVGAAVAIGLLVLLLAISFAMGGRDWATVFSKKPFIVRLIQVIGAAIIVSVAEEFLFRGYLKDLLGGWGSAAMYAAVHFFKPLQGSAPAGGGFDPWISLRRADVMFESWFDPRVALTGMVGLFLFGLALNRLRERTGTLYLGIGLHAGLVFALGLYRVWVDGVSPNPWIHGGSRVHDGVLGVVFLGLVCLAAYKLPLPRSYTASAGPDPEFRPEAL